MSPKIAFNRFEDTPTKKKKMPKNPVTTRDLDFLEYGFFQITAMPICLCT